MDASNDVLSIKFAPGENFKHRTSQMLSIELDTRRQMTLIYKHILELGLISRVCQKTPMPFGSGNCIQSILKSFLS